MRLVILKCVRTYQLVSHYGTFYKLVWREWSAYNKFLVHLALAGASTDGKSLEKLKMTLAGSRWSKSKSSERFVPPHTVILYVTTGTITLKYRSRSGNVVMYCTRPHQLSALNIHRV